VEAVVSQAMAGASGGAVLDDLGDLDDLESFNDDVFDDPLGISESWEGKSSEQTEPRPEPAGGSGDKPQTP